MTNVWNERASMYVESDAHRTGEDLDTLVEWAEGASMALDVATGGGHVARRLREAGIEVITCDAAPGMHPDVVCTAESLPFADHSFDVVACRTAAHHFVDVGMAVSEMARVTRGTLILVDTVYMGDDVEAAEKLRDPSHVRNYTDAEWRSLVADTGLGIDQVRFFEHTFDFGAWLARTGCEGDDAVRAEALLGDRVVDGRLTLAKLAIRAVRGF